MAIVAGVDFGTLSVRVTIVDAGKGRLGTGIAEYPLHRKKEDPDHATQSHADHMRALGEAVEKAVASAPVSRDQGAALAIDTTGSGGLSRGGKMEPLGHYYPCVDHRSWGDAARMTHT